MKSRCKNRDIRGEDRNQIQFHTNILEEYLGEYNPVRDGRCKETFGGMGVD